MTNPPSTSWRSEIDDAHGRAVDGPGARADEPLWTSLRRRIDVDEGLFIATDFDGTLAPICDRPDAASILPDARSALAALADHPTVDVAVVSGRALDDLRDRVGLDDVCYAGNHGLEIERPDGRFVHPAADEASSQLASACERLRERLADVEDVFVEEKGVTASVHYRRVDDDSAVDCVRESAHEIVDRFDTIVSRGGKQVVELGPAVDWDKGRAVAWLFETVPDGNCAPHPIYVGDDVTDEDAFRALDGVGTTIAVGRDPDETAADFVVSDPAAVSTVLSWLERLVGQERRRRRRTPPPIVGGYVRSDVRRYDRCVGGTGRSRHR